MAISRIGTATGTTSATLPSFTAGDVAVVAAYRDGVATAPTVPAGWETVISGSGNTNAQVIGWRVLLGSDTTTGTWTNATSVTVHVYRSSTSAVVIGASATATGSSTTISFPALTLKKTNNTSWIAGFAGHRSTDTSITTTVPTGMGNRSGSNTNGTNGFAGHDTGGTVSSWSLQTASVGGTTSGWMGQTVELVEGTPGLLRQVRVIPASFVSGTAYAFDTTVLQGSLLVIGIAHNDTLTNVATVTDSQGNTYAIARECEMAAITATAIIYYAIAGSTGANSVTVTIGFPGILTLLEYQGGWAASPLDQGANANGVSNAPASGSFTPTQNNELVVGLFYCSGALSAPGSGFTVDANSGNSWTESLVQGTAASVNANCTQSGSTNWLAAGASFKPAGAGSSGTLSKTLDVATVVAAATSTISGLFSQGLAALTSLATAVSTIVGTAAPTLGALTVAASGKAPAVGTATKTLDAVTLTATGGAPALSGAAALTLAALTASATATAPAAGTASLTLAALTVVATGAAPAVGTAAPTLAALTLVATGGGVPALGTASITLGALTVAAAGVAPAVGTATKTLDALTVVATATAPITGTASPTLAAATVAATATAPITGTAAPTLAALTTTATGAVPAVGTLTRTLGTLTLAATGKGPGIAFINSSDGQGTSAVSTTALAVQAGNCLAIVIGKRPSTVTITGVTDTAGNTYTRRGPISTNGTAPSLAVEIWTSAPSCLGHAANVVTVSASGSPLKLAAIQAQYSGVGGFGSGNESVNSGGAGSNPSTSIAVAAHSSYGLIGTTVGGAGSFTASLGTLREQIQTTSGPDSDNFTTLLGDNTNADAVLNTIAASGAGHHADVSIELIFGVSGGLAQTLGSLTLVGAAASAVTGAASPALAALTLVATGSVLGGSLGTLAATLAALTATATGKVTAVGTLTATLAAVTASATATVKVTGSAAKTLDALTLAATGSVASPVAGTLAKTLAPVTLVATGGLPGGPVGTLAQTLLPLTAVAAATSTIRGAGGATLGALTCAATAVGPRFGELNRELEPLRLVATGSAIVPPRPPVPQGVLRPRVQVPVGPHRQPHLLVGPVAGRRHHLALSGAADQRVGINIGGQPQRSILGDRPRRNILVGPPRRH